MTFISGFRPLALTSFSGSFTYFSHPGLTAEATPEPGFFGNAAGTFGCWIRDILHFGRRTSVYYAGLVGPPPSLSQGNLKAAMDAILAAHPEVTHFTLEPSGNVGMEYGVGICGEEISITPTSDPYNIPYAGAPDGTNTHGWFARKFIDDRAWTVDGVTSEIAVRFAGENREPELDFFPGDWFGGTVMSASLFVYPDEPGNFQYTPNFGMSVVGAGYGLQTFLLRPTALTWADQDPTNAANRIFWQYGDISPGDAASVMHGTGGRIYINTSDGISLAPASDVITVRGWEIVTLSDPVIPAGVIAAGNPISGRLLTERNAVRGTTMGDSAVIG